jgi:hypothetical protein
MTTEQCPRCHKKTLRVTNVMGTTERVHYACSMCCYKEKRDYAGIVVEHSPLIFPVIDAEELQKKRKMPNAYHWCGCLITEVPVDRRSE